METLNWTERKTKDETLDIVGKNRNQIEKIKIYKILS